MNGHLQEYRLADLRSTTGWHISMDPNVRDRLSMLPAEVAIQAGNLAEFIAITTHPKFRLESRGHAELYMLVGLRAGIVPYPEVEMRNAIVAVASVYRTKAMPRAISI